MGLYCGISDLFLSLCCDNALMHLDPPRLSGKRAGSSDALEICPQLQVLECPVSSKPFDAENLVSARDAKPTRPSLPEVLPWADQHIWQSMSQQQRGSQKASGRHSTHHGTSHVCFSTGITSFLDHLFHKSVCLQIFVLAIPWDHQSLFSPQSFQHSIVD